VNSKKITKPPKRKNSVLSKPNIPVTRSIYNLVHRVMWPIDGEVAPSLLKGRNDVEKNLSLRINEDIWLSIEAHCASLDVTKSEWIRFAMLRLLQYEQQWFINKSKENK
jgi:hypothetical protein